MAIAIKRIKDDLMNRINKEDTVQVEKVERYINLIGLMRTLQKQVEADGATVVTVNGPQEFTKAHPALGEISKLNSQLLSIEKAFVFAEIEVETNEPEGLI